MIPVGAIIAAARVSVAVVDASIESNVWTPVSAIENVNAVVVTPPRRRPQRAHPRSQNPGPGDPVISDIRIVPVTRCPNVILAGTRRLTVFGKRRRRLAALHNRFVRRSIIILPVGWLARRRLTGRNWLAVILSSSSRILSRIIGRCKISVGRISIAQLRRLICFIATTQPCQ
jgi:hypothetical protein